MRHLLNRLQQRATHSGHCRWRSLWMWALVLMGFVLSASAGQEESVVLEIKPDGACLIRREQTQFRRDLEQMAQAFQQQEKDSENDNSDKEAAEDSDKAEQPGRPQAARKLSDDELLAAVKKIYSINAEMFGGASEGNSGMESIILEKEMIRMAFTNSFLSVREMLSSRAWYIPMVYGASLKIEKAGTNQVRMTYKPFPNERFWDRLADSFKREGTKVEYKVILPGRIISSGFSNINDRTTWLTIDSKNRESLTNVLERLRKPIEIVSESGGLSLEEPLDSMILTRRGSGGDASESTQAVSAESTNYTILLRHINITTVYTFPGASNNAPASSFSQRMRYGQQNQGMMFGADVQPPPGRKLLSIANIQVIKATDNRGQPLKLKAEKPKPSSGSKEAVKDESTAAPIETATTPSEPGSETTPTVPEDDNPGNNVNDSELPEMAEASGEDSGAGEENTTVFAQNQDNRPIQIYWTLPAPSPEISAIEEMEMTGIARTISGWKTVTLSNVQASATNAIDLSSLLPGTRLFITQFKAGKQNKNLEARLEGPPGIRDFEIKFITSEINNSMNMSERNFINKGNQSVRKISVQSYDYSQTRDKSEDPPGVLIRFPEDSKREKVRFKLVGLDIY